MSTMPGFFAFLILFLAKFGAKCLHVISRVNNPYNPEAWVIHFCRDIGLFDLGMPRENLHLVRHKTGKQGKGVVAHEIGCTHFIDDSAKVFLNITNTPPTFIETSPSKWP